MKIEVSIKGLGLDETIALTENSEFYQLAGLNSEKGTDSEDETRIRVLSAVLLDAIDNAGGAHQGPRHKAVAKTEVEKGLLFALRALNP